MSPDPGVTPIGIVGCGFVADLYMRTLERHPDLSLVAAVDRNPERAKVFAEHWGVTTHETLAPLLEDDRVQLVLNLTNPASHDEVSRACLEAGKHVYSEKPLAMNMDQAEQLVVLARDKGLQLTSAPCSVFSEAAQTAWKAVRENRIGPVRLVYAELDDGFIPRAPYLAWASESGAPWPAEDEFEVGCTLEHAGYYLTWLMAMFGPAETVTAFSSDQVPGKPTDNQPAAPDFSVACIQFVSGVVARLTCSIVAPHDHTLRVIGDDGVLYVDDCWFYRSPVYTRKRRVIRRRMLLSPFKRKLKLVSPPGKPMKRWGAAAMDFARGPAEMARAIREGRPNPLPIDFALHINEVTLAIQNAGQRAETYQVRTTFEPIEPMPWAK